MNAKSKEVEDDIEDILNDPFATFTEWSSRADREAYRAWSESEAERAKVPRAASHPDCPIKKR